MSPGQASSLPGEPHLLALDWGTSSLRGALLDAHGQVLDERTSSSGLLSVPSGGWADDRFSNAHE